MTRDKLIDEYFEWMCQIVYDRRYCKRGTYRRLLMRLYDIDFTYIIPLDGNRAEDGINLRYKFGYECHYSDPIIATYLDNRSCSVLEMLIALAFRCEDHIMDSDVGNRTGEWFWGMINNLGLITMIDTDFDRDYVDVTIDILLSREYEGNGKGGLFTIEHPKRDLRFVEIWYQMCWYLDSVLNKKD